MHTITPHHAPTGVYYYCFPKREFFSTGVSERDSDGGRGSARACLEINSIVYV
jgi:hypothetical protein